MTTCALAEVCSEQNPDPDRQRVAIERLIRSGAHIDACDKNGVTALHHAVRFRSPAAVETLLRLGADANRACTRSGSTPLHRAATSTGAPGTAGKRAEALAIIEILLRFGANPAIRNKRGKRPADYTRDPAFQKLLGSRPSR
jgi:ankyrin repeat protein